MFSLSWVESFYIGVAREPEKSWQIYITCAKDKVPSMVDLKKLFGAEIASFVDFIQESAKEHGTNSDESCSGTYLRGPISGDELCVQEEKGGYGRIGVLTHDHPRHYATTCYHVCFKKDLPEDNGHQVLKEDYDSGSPGCKDVTCVYKTEDGSLSLGKFLYGIYDDHHDIALIELEPGLNCSDTIEFLRRENNIEPALASKIEVGKMFIDSPNEMRVEMIRPRRDSTEGILFAISGKSRCPRNKRCYQIKKMGRKRFSKKGDSGSLVYLVYNEKKIPFAYVCTADNQDGKIVYYCRNLSCSIDELSKKHKLNTNIKNPCLLECNSQQTHEPNT